jgi:hypothetical protein
MPLHECFELSRRMRGGRSKLCAAPNAQDHIPRCPKIGRISDIRPRSGQKPDNLTPLGG